MTTFAAITGWGSCMPQAVLTNADLATFLETSDEWIVSRTGMKELCASHAALSVLSHRMVLHFQAEASGAGTENILGL